MEENAFFLKNKLIFDFYMYELFHDKRMADDILELLQKPNIYNTNCFLWYGIAGLGLILKKIDYFDSNIIRKRISLIVSKNINDLSNCCPLNHRYYDLFSGLIGKGQYLLYEGNHETYVLKIIKKIEQMIRNLNVQNYRFCELMQKSNFYIIPNLKMITWIAILILAWHMD